MRDELASRLSELNDNLDATVDDVQMLAEIQQGIGRLLADDDRVEGEIRDVLQEHFDGGNLRKETYQLVKAMLDRYAIEHSATMSDNVTYDTIGGPAPDENSEVGDDGFSSTTVLPGDAFEPVDADDQVQVGSVLRDRFLLQKRIAGGSMGVVYKALDRRLAEVSADNPYVAIKVLSPQLAKSGPGLRALQQEAAKGRNLTHPNIVRFIDFDRDDDLYFIIMEWLEGRTLADILDSPDGKHIKLADALGIVRQVGRALEFAHRAGIVHADVKPGNVMIAPNGDAKLFDFGVARVRQTQEQDARAGGAAVLRALTPAYSSMQVLTGEEPTPADDVFSLGCLMYRLVAGYRVFGPRNAAEAAEAGMTPQPIEALSDRQWAALKKAISYSRVTRYDTIAAFMRELDGDADIDLPIAVGDRLVVDEPERRRYWPWVFLLLSILAGAGSVQMGWHEVARDWIGERLQTGVTPVPAPRTDAAVDDVAVEESPGDAPGPAGESGSDALQGSSRLPEQVADESLAAGVSQIEENASVADAPVTDFSQLPPADLEVPLIAGSGDDRAVTLRLREGTPASSVDLMRTDDLAQPLRLRIEEVGYSGNRSPWASLQYSISENGIIEIPPGQDRARISLDMADDPLREADQLSMLRVREAESTRTRYAAIELILEDDDQRAFEAELPADTIAFAVSQVSVSENDPAVQIDVLRFNPSDQPVVLGYAVRPVTATDSEDYFAPSGYSLSFGPRQRSARLLIPLVQDSIYEGDEAFTVELASRNESAPSDVFQRIVVMIRDDDNP